MRWFIFIIFLLLTQFYVFQAIKTVTNNKILFGIYLSFVIIVYGILIYYFFTRFSGFTNFMEYSIGFFLALSFFQLILLSVVFLEDIIRFFQFLFSFSKNNLNYDQTSFPQRRKFISQAAIILASIPFSAILFGMYKGKYNYKVLSYDLEFDDLPSSFDGFKITQISDLHSGSFDNPKKVEYGLNLVHDQKSDLILFTGDIVNNKTKELLPWVKLFSALKAPYGIFSVLGNHDYGDYTNWENKEAKKANMDLMFSTQEKMGWKLLNNDSVYLDKNGEKIAIVGVENWGKGRFKKAGDLNKSVEKISKKDFKILLTHDPSHWDAEVLKHKHKFHLTLSGHTHGFQFGIEIPGFFKWSPSQWQYKQWAGIYKKNNQFLNVNRGFGYLAYPGRVGIWPEITVITLRKSKL
jgi:predicted MPP superfamily phosphohydrolase